MSDPESDFMDMEVHDEAKYSLSYLLKNEKNIIRGNDKDGC